jgi:hypothetical protein
MQRFRTHLALLSLPLVAACSQPPAPSDGATPADAAASMDATTGADGALSMDGNGASAIESAYATGAVGAATEQEVCAALRAGPRGGANGAAPRGLVRPLRDLPHGRGPSRRRSPTSPGRSNARLDGPRRASTTERNVPVLAANALAGDRDAAPRSPLAVAADRGPLALPRARHQRARRTSATRRPRRGELCRVARRWSSSSPAPIRWLTAQRRPPTGAGLKRRHRPPRRQLLLPPRPRGRATFFTTAFLPGATLNGRRRVRERGPPGLPRRRRASS